MPRLYRQSTANSALLGPTPSTRSFFPIRYVTVHPRNHIHKTAWQIIVIAIFDTFPEIKLKNRKLAFWKIIFKFAVLIRLIALTAINLQTVSAKNQMLFFFCQGKALYPPDITFRVPEGIIRTERDSFTADLPESTNDVIV